MKHQLLTISLLLTTVGFSQQKFTLQEAQQYALAHAYGMEIAELEIERAKQIYRQTWPMDCRKLRLRDSMCTTLNLAH